MGPTLLRMRIRTERITDKKEQQAIGGAGGMANKKGASKRGLRRQNYLGRDRVWDKTSTKGKWGFTYLSLGSARAHLQGQGLGEVPQ